MQYGDHWVTGHDRSSLRLLGTAGEPINPSAWAWYHDVSLARLLALLFVLQPWQSEHLSASQPVLASLSPAGSNF
jgi:acyl-coenzyme A synthetase/AMP-(fatty) acid ligase